MLEGDTSIIIIISRSTMHYHRHINHEVRLHDHRAGAYSNPDDRLRWLRHDHGVCPTSPWCIRAWTGVLQQAEDDAGSGSNGNGGGVWRVGWWAR